MKTLTKEKTGAPLKLFDVEVVYLCVAAITMAFIGWVAENVGRIVTYGIIDCRFHILPFIGPYGLIVFVLHIFLGDPDNSSFCGIQVFKNPKHRKLKSNIYTAVVVFAAVFVGELAVGNAWEILCGAKLWDYSNQPLHVTQYAGLIPTVLYGSFAWLIYRFAMRPYINLLRKKLSCRAALIISVTIGIAIILDSVALLTYTIIMSEGPMYWSIKLW